VISSSSICMLFCTSVKLVWLGSWPQPRSVFPTKLAIQYSISEGTSVDDLHIAQIHDALTCRLAEEARAAEGRHANVHSSRRHRSPNGAVAKGQES
jgi:hypothetical protein